ncbi:hypothetical protein BC943DRAFT_274522 [Umbelopsis sp. AD052]|nr:hypothetical protein BC943DRAFT_274522 [Umbelopsis sp. AD052]
MGDEQKKTEVEIQRLDEFVKQAPIGDYNIDQEKQRICHQLGSGQEKCVQLNLEATEMFSQMQKLGFFCALPMDPTKTHMECKHVSRV